jgi:hypothetical protein
MDVTADQPRAAAIAALRRLADDLHDGGMRANARVIREALAALAPADPTADLRAVERIIVAMEREGVVEWGDSRHRRRFILALAASTTEEA